METLRNKWKLAAASRELQEITRNNQPQNTSVPGVTEEYNMQFSEQMESRVTKKLFQDISRAESRIFGALSKIDEFLLSP